MGRAVVGAEVEADRCEVVTFEIEEAPGEIQGVVPWQSGKRDAKSCCMGVDH